MRRTAVPLGLALAAALATAQEPIPQASPAPQAPVFEVGVDLVAVDVSVVDSEGRPVLGLRPEDFDVEMDGKPHSVASTEYIGREIEPPRAVPQPTHYSSNEYASPGRLVLLLVDRGNLGHGSGRLAMAAAERFLGTLTSSDRVGLATVPGPGQNIEFTGEHDQVRRALRHIVGQGNRAGFQVPLSEAIAYLKLNDRLRWQQFVDLECGHFTLVAQLDQCIQQMETEAQQVYLNYRERSLQSRRALETVFLSLQSVPGPKTVVLISEGLATESPAESRRLAEAAAQAQVTLFVLLLDSSSVDAAYRKEQLATPEEREIEAASLYDLAGMTRGAVLPVIGSADGPFQRIARELMGYYLVGFEPLADDRDGKQHSIRVKVKRGGVSVRWRSVLNIPAAAPSPQQAISAALRSPLVERGLLIRVATYARPAPEGKVRLLLAAEVAQASRPVSVGFALFGPNGKVAASRMVEGLSSGEAGSALLYAGEATVDPGAYTLRLAAIDASGRRGSVHHEAKAAVVSAGGLRISDLVLAPPGEGALRPVVDLAADSTGLLAFVELAGKDQATLAGAAVALEVAESETGAALLRVPVEVSSPGADGVRVARVTLAGGLIPPGEYFARAAISADGKPVAALTRPFQVASPPAGVRPTSVPLAALLGERRPYERAAVLDPELLAHFLDRMSELVPGPLPPDVAAAVALARAGRPEAMLEPLAAARSVDARVSFLRGVALYALGRLDASLSQLQAALRASSDFFPAAVYMGACYAAGGKDLDAIGAWQTALIGESRGAAVLYALLADALMRVREADQAVAILDEGLAAFPEDTGLRRRLGLAHAMAGHPEEALTLLSAWVDGHPEDTRALFATLAVLFESFSRETVGAVKAEERQRLRRYAKAYVDGKGPNSEIVELWLRYLDSRAGG